MIASLHIAHKLVIYNVPSVATHGCCASLSLDGFDKDCGRSVQPVRWRTHILKQRYSSYYDLPSGPDHRLSFERGSRRLIPLFILHKKIGAQAVGRDID
jgi:hypothetical protein